MTFPSCPQCQSEYTYSDGVMLLCPDCAHEWHADADEDEAAAVVKDAYGTLLQDGDTVTLIKDLKLKGSSTVLKVGTKAKGIRLQPDAADGHDIDCRIEGMGAMKLKSEFVKKPEAVAFKYLAALDTQ